MHLSRSPGIAYAVSAMIGVLRAITRSRDHAFTQSHNQACNQASTQSMGFHLAPVACCAPHKLDFLLSIGACDGCEMGEEWPN
eukprot:826446-Prymnesium_polylepis.1